MTIQGSGGGRRVPPATGASVTSTKGTPAPAAATTGPSTSPASSSQRGDSFDAATRGPGHSSGEGATVAASRGHSGVRTMLRVLEDTRAQVLEEHASLQQDASRIVAELARGRFEKALVEGRRQELTRIRDRMAALRRRLHKTRRRIKAALEQVGRTGPSDLARELDASLRRLDEMKPGVHKALGALELVDQAFSSLCDDGGPVLRAPATADGDAAATTTAARAAPGALVSEGAIHLLRNGPPLPAVEDAARAPRALDVDVLQRILRDAWIR